MTPPASPKTLTESQILSAVRLAANDYPDLRLWRLSQGGAVTRGGHTYTAGLSVGGASDLIGLLTVRLASGDDGSPPAYYHYALADEYVRTIGRFVAFEVKTPQALARIRRAVARGNTSRLTRTEQNQLLFLNVVRTMGGFACHVDSVDAFRAAVGRARKGESE